MEIGKAAFVLVDPSERVSFRGGHCRHRRLLMLLSNPFPCYSAAFPLQFGCKFPCNSAAVFPARSRVMLRKLL